MVLVIYQTGSSRKTSVWWSKTFRHFCMKAKGLICHLLYREPKKHPLHAHSGHFYIAGQASTSFFFFFTFKRFVRNWRLLTRKFIIQFLTDTCGAITFGESIYKRSNRTGSVLPLRNQPTSISRLPYQQKKEKDWLEGGENTDSFSNMSCVRPEMPQVISYIQ